MHFFLETAKRLKCGWNEKPLSPDDFYRLCRIHKINVEEMPLSVSGFYYSLLGKHYIAVNSRLRAEMKLFVMFHEFAHFLMHAPDDGVTANFHGIGKKTRKEQEADAFALCAIIPRRKIENSTAEELIDSGLSREFVKKRLDLFAMYGI